MSGMKTADLFGPVIRKANGFRIFVAVRNQEGRNGQLVAEFDRLLMCGLDQINVLEANQLIPGPVRFKVGPSSGASRKRARRAFRQIRGRNA